MSGVRHNRRNTAIRNNSKRNRNTSHERISYNYIRLKCEFNFKSNQRNCNLAGAYTNIIIMGQWSLENLTNHLFSEIATKLPCFALRSLHKLPLYKCIYYHNNRDTAYIKNCGVPIVGQ